MPRRWRAMMPALARAGLSGIFRMTEKPSLWMRWMPAENAEAASRLQMETSQTSSHGLMRNRKPSPDARRLVADVQIRPFSSLRKIYIVPDAHLMNVEAQNTLLKTLEEPPEYVVLLLLCDSADMMLETIRSRCVMISLESAALTMPEESLRLAMSILLNIHEWTMPEILGAVRELSGNKLMITEFLDLFTSWYRDVLYFKATGDADGILHEEYVQEIRRASAHSSYEGIQNILDALHTAGIRLKANVNFELTIELLLLSMKEN